jgi:hypothetical protein
VEPVDSDEAAGAEAGAAGAAVLDELAAAPSVLAGALVSDVEESDDELLFEE